MDFVCSCGEWRSYSSLLFSSIFFPGQYIFSFVFLFPLLLNHQKMLLISLFHSFFSCSRSYKILRLRILLITFPVICHIFPDICFHYFYTSDEFVFLTVVLYQTYVLLLTSFFFTPCIFLILSLLASKIGIGWEH